MPKVRWAVLYRFCSKFHSLSSSAKSLKTDLRFDKVTESSQCTVMLCNVTNLHCCQLSFGHHSVIETSQLLFRRIVMVIC